MTRYDNLAEKAAEAERLEQEKNDETPAEGTPSDETPAETKNPFDYSPENNNGENPFDYNRKDD